MSARLLQVLVLRLRRPAEARPALERRTEDGPPFRLSLELRGLFEKKVLDARTGKANPQIVLKFRGEGYFS
jgi:hypothetical protein